jgi:hypothetical protein
MTAKEALNAANDATPGERFRRYETTCGPRRESAPPTRYDSPWNREFTAPRDVILAEGSRLAWAIGWGDRGRLQSLRYRDA